MARGLRNRQPSSDPTRFVNRTGPDAAQRRRARQAATRRPTAGNEPAGARHEERYPAWRDLSDSNFHEAGGQKERWTLVDAIPTFRMAAAIVVLGLVSTLYVGHVLATQDLMARAESLRRENLALHLRANRVKGEFDRASGPQVIHERARALGLSQRTPNGPSLEID